MPRQQYLNQRTSLDLGRARNRYFGRLVKSEICRGAVDVTGRNETSLGLISKHAELLVSARENYDSPVSRRQRRIEWRIIVNSARQCRFHHVLVGALAP
jgi:hypothetical protein